MVQILSRAAYEGRVTMRNYSTQPRLVATLLKSGTWYSTSFFWLYNQLLARADVSRPRWYDFALKHSHRALPSIDLANAIATKQLRDKQRLAYLHWNPLYVCHTICPGYSDIDDPSRHKWDKLAFYSPGYNYGEALMGRDAATGLNPVRNSHARIVYLFRNPLDQCISCWEHAQRHRDERQRQMLQPDGTLRPIKDLLDFIFNASALDSFIKHFHTFKVMQARYGDNVLMVSYEAMVTAPEAAFEMMLAHLGSPAVTDAERKCVAQAVAMCSRDSMKRVEERIGHSLPNDQTGSHVRDGRIGQWREHLGTEDLARIERRLNEFGMSVEHFTVES